jgi:Glycosyltransferase family 9 (heptosyltransferase)
MIHVHVSSPPPSQLIGDSLAQVPFMRAIAELRGEHVRVTGTFNKHVIPLLEGMPISFDYEGTGAGAEFVVSPMDAMLRHHRLGSTLHMAQVYFDGYGLPVPALPIDLPLVSEPCGLPSGLVISPFSLSDFGTNTKRWPHERWVQVAQTLRRLGLADRIYVLGSHANDQVEPYAVAGIEPVFDRPLTQVLDLMRNATLFMSVDTGTAHIAHFGGVKRHVLIYPDCQPRNWAEAPRAIHVRGPRPADISVDQVLEAARRVLHAPCQVKVLA